MNLLRNIFSRREDQFSLKNFDNEQERLQKRYYSYLDENNKAHAMVILGLLIDLVEEYIPYLKKDESYLLDKQKGYQDNYDCIKKRM